MVTLRVGDKGNSVKVLQEKLGISIDGIFGPLTEQAVKTFQLSNKLTVDGIVGKNTWKLLGITAQTKRYIKEIIVHCAATPEGKDFRKKDITAWHKQRGFTTIGYNWLIYLDGTIVEGRDENLIPAACSGHNAQSINVCYIGGCTKDGKTPKDTRTSEQKKALLKILMELKVKYPNAKIHSHRDFANKACPSFDATGEYKDI